MASIFCKQGDSVTLSGAFVDEAGDPIDLTDAEVNVWVKRANEHRAEPVLDGASAEIDADESTGLVSVTTVADFAPGEYWFLFRARMDDEADSVYSAPRAGYYSLQVEQPLGAAPDPIGEPE